MSTTPEQQQHWNEVSEYLQSLPHIQEVSYNTWIKPLKLYSVRNRTVCLVGTAFQMNLVRTRYFTDIFNAIQMHFGKGYELELKTEEEVDAVTTTTTLNSQYTFDNFVTGPSNSFATAAALAVAEQPGDAYNPLFIYGNVGLGKTHLMNAIGNFIMAEDPSKNVVLTSSENFTNEVIDAIAQRDTPGLRAKMRNVDVFLIDDIQFLARTKATQEEFFHTFNDLHSAHKQIVISSDRPPKDIPTLEERLRSRFAWGLIVDIQKPEYETRIAILRKKASLEKMDISFEVLDYIAQHVDSSVRELEGTLTRLKAECDLLKTPITIQACEDFFRQTKYTRNVKAITPDVIIDAVCSRYSVEREDILSSKRSRNIAMPRQIAMYLCRQLTQLSTTVVGESFGGRDHTTVMHACEKVAKDMKDDYSFARQIDELTMTIKNG